MASTLMVLNEMREILVRDERPEFASRLAQIAAAHEGEEFAEAVTGLDVWGGSGSLVDATLRSPTDDRRLNELIVDLAEALDCMGIGTPRTRWVGQTIEDWLIAHPI